MESIPENDIPDEDDDACGDAPGDSLDDPFGDAAGDSIGSSGKSARNRMNQIQCLRVQSRFFKILYTYRT